MKIRFIGLLSLILLLLLSNSLDAEGVGQLVEMATVQGRKGREDIKIGICGEHGGDPSSIEFCHKIGLDYVSCSPYRVPIARLASAQAALRDRQSGKAGKTQHKKK